jgi:hypothetical protein
MPATRQSAAGPNICHWAAGRSGIENYRMTPRTTPRSEQDRRACRRNQHLRGPGRDALKPVLLVTSEDAGRIEGRADGG